MAPTIFIYNEARPRFLVVDSLAMFENKGMQSHAVARSLNLPPANAFNCKAALSSVQMTPVLISLQLIAGQVAWVIDRFTT
jgi:hypothetical protein